MRMIMALAALVAATVSSQNAHAQKWGDLKVKFVFDGKAEEAAAISITRDQAFCGKHDLKDESLIVGKDGGVKNVIVYAYEGRGGAELPAVHPSAKEGGKTLELANDKCRFEPHVLLCRVGDTLKVTNPDEVGHNANMQFLSNTAQNITIPPGASKDVKLALAEPAPITVECNIHPWMKAKVVVLDHGYMAASGEDGSLVIKNLPVGEVALRLNHERQGRMSGLKIGSSALDRRNVFMVEIEEGENDLGVVKIPAKMFK